jgi:hypothetical protein
MPAFLVTGNPGSGKSELARELTRRGVLASLTCQARLHLSSAHGTAASSKPGPFLRLDMGRLQRSFQRPDVLSAVAYVPIPGKRDQLRSYSGRKALVSADEAALC